MQQAKIEIKKPCLVNLDGVVPDENGRFCSVCQKSVVDFTHMSPQEIAVYFQQQHTEKHCGTFNSWDVKSDNKIDRLILFLQNKRLKFLAVLIIGLLFITGCRIRTRGVVAYSENPRTLGGTTTQPYMNKDSIPAPGPR